MKYKTKLYLIPILCLFAGLQSYSQEESKSIRLGISFGMGTQQIFPYNNIAYKYNVQGYRGLINYPLKKSGKFSYELQIEPGIYKARHKLLIKDFVQPNFGANYLEQREIFAQEKTITEFALNLGILARYNLREKISLFFLGSTGPMFSDTATERLAKGFAFSNIFALGVAYKVRKITFELRTGIRHVSNLNMQFPNSGHNSSNIDFGISVAL